MNFLQGHSQGLGSSRGDPGNGLCAQRDMPLSCPLQTGPEGPGQRVASLG
jgi:hypothetical protein